MFQTRNYIILYVFFISFACPTFIAGLFMFPLLAEEKTGYEPWGITPFGRWTEISVVVVVLGLMLLASWKLIRIWHHESKGRELRYVQELTELRNIINDSLKEYYETMHHVAVALNERNVIIQNFIEVEKKIIERMASSTCVLLGNKLSNKTRQRVLKELGILSVEELEINDSLILDQSTQIPTSIDEENK